MRNTFISFLSISALVFAIGCGEDDDNNNPSAAESTSFDENLIGTWVEGTMEDGVFTEEAPMLQDTFEISKSSFGAGPYSIPSQFEDSSCKPITNDGKIGVSCPNEETYYVYDYMIEDGYLYFEIPQEECDGAVDKAIAEVYKKIE